MAVGTVVVILFVSLFLYVVARLFYNIVRYGTSGMFVGGKVLFEGQPLTAHSSKLGRMSQAVVRSTNKKRPIAIKLRSNSVASFSMQAFLMSDQHARQLLHAIEQAAAELGWNTEVREFEAFSMRWGLAHQRFTVKINGRFAPMIIRVRSIAPMAFGIRWIPLGPDVYQGFHSQLERAISLGEPGELPLAEGTG